MPALRATPVAELRELNFPAADDAQDMFTLKTERGMGHVDQGTGTLLDCLEPGFEAACPIPETVYCTGEAPPRAGLILGLMALGVPVLAVTGC